MINVWIPWTCYSCTFSDADPVDVGSGSDAYQASTTRQRWEVHNSMNLTLGQYHRLEETSEKLF